MSLLAQIAKRFAPQEWHGVIDAGVDAMGNYSHDKEGALKLIKDMGGTTADVQKMVNLANSDERLGKFFNALNVDRRGINQAANEIMGSGGNAPQQPQQAQSGGSLDELRRRFAKLK